VLDIGISVFWGRLRANGFICQQAGRFFMPTLKWPKLKLQLEIAISGDGECSHHYRKLMQSIRFNWRGGADMLGNMSIIIESALSFVNRCLNLRGG
jgi:hypothetical protein